MNTAYSEMAPFTPPKRIIEIPHNYVVPAAVMAELCREHPAPPLPVYADLMKDLSIGLYSGRHPLPPFEIPAFVLGHPLYDAAEAARWMADTLTSAGYEVTVRSRASDPEARDLWPDRRGSEALKFPYDVAKYEAVLAAPVYEIEIIA